MKILAMELDLLFDDSDYFENNVEIISHTDGSFSAVCKVPGFIEQEECSVDLTEDFECVYDLISEFMLRDVTDLKEITPELMYRRFQTGRCDLYCYVEPDHEVYLIYRWEKDKLIATTFDDRKHEVPVYAKTPQELLVYARYYLENMLSIPQQG